MNRIYRLESENLATSCGFQEMPHWSTDLQNQGHLRNDSVILGTGWQTMNFSRQDGLNHAGNTVSTNNS